MTMNSGWLTARTRGSDRKGSSEMVTASRFATASNTMTVASGIRTSAAIALRIMKPA
jgi:hypothetical protein